MMIIFRRLDAVLDGGRGLGRARRPGRRPAPPAHRQRGAARPHLGQRDLRRARRGALVQGGGGPGLGGPGGGGGGAGPRRGQQCSVCQRHHPDKAHPAELALDASDGWWQSPTLAEGPQYEHVAVTLDLLQVYLVSYVILKTGPSPRPAAWVLERSADEAGETFTPWQYFAPTDEDCWSRYGVPATPGDPAKAVLDRDDDVICTSFHSKAYPAEDAAVHTWLVKGRPGANASSESLRAFQAARRVRLRLEKLSQAGGPAGGALADPRRAFYSIKFLSIGAQCDCNGHASKCNVAGKSGQVQRAVSGPGGCRCQHNTEGAACERCRPRFNQEPWRHGAPCVECQCHGHARACRYDPEVARAAASVDKHGVYRGGGVCLNCSDHTDGVNCERCAVGWFRLPGVAPDASKPCVPCECHPEGSTGVCAPDGTNPEVEAGACECRDGYAGYHCDRCAPGFRNFPACEPCPCDPRGSEHAADCDGECFCKAHVEGARCDRCRPGYFGLDARDPNGCSACYCSGITTDCTEAVLTLTEVDQYQGWLVGDIRVTETVTPVVDQDTGLLTVADADLDVYSYYWVAPPAYRGNLLASYGSTLTFRTSWVVMRGDTSGKPTPGPDLVLIGSNGMRVGHGDSVHAALNATVTVPLREARPGEVPGDGWYLLRDGVRDISTRLRRTGSDQDGSPYRGEPATRNQLLSVLADVQHVLVRAKYHRDQVDGALEAAVLRRGAAARAEDAGGALALVEQCTCPDGYEGLSCESCAWGHARVSAQGLASNATTGLASGHRGLCVRCNCNGHAATCDPDTNACGACEHHTTGERCERCAPGYFGDALRGLPGDCRPCACPLLLPSNNFSPTCELQTPDVTDNDVVEDYVCTACPAGHAGKHCERCADGHYGDPSAAGERCRPCECAGGPCDALTGRCLSCPDNTDGWRCEKCKPGHYGDPAQGCRPCGCSALGSASDACHGATGQCECRPRFSGRTCERCEDGLGNVTAGCVACACDPRGAASPACDPVTGLCPCRTGYAPPHCAACLQHHYHNPDTGCEGCGCHASGALHAACDIVTGRCECKTNVVGRACDACKHGFWGLDSGLGCQACACDPLGAHNSSCDAVTGQCACRPGIGGRTCDSCLPGYVGFSPDGCRECDPCDKPGHVCDPDTGHCVCPPLTFGDECEVCEMNSWGFRSGKGCKACACDPAGSYASQCDAGTGQCSCRRGYAGPRCDTCAHGFYGFPSCRSCRCDARGADPASCDASGLCGCGPGGQCRCKPNAAGPRCDACRPGTFGLRADDADGCEACFCFGRSSLCSEEGLTWGRLTQFRPRTLDVHYESTNPQFRPGAQLFPVNTKEICYINLALPGVPGASAKTTNSTPDRLDVINNLRIIPGDAGDVEMGVNYLFDTPVYWQLPRQFLGDRVLSFGGFLRFSVEAEGGSTLFPPEVLGSYPLVQLQGNNRIVLEHFPTAPSRDGHYEIRLHHSLWRVKNNATSKVSRELLMLALQNVQHVLIRATDSIDFTKAVLRGISLDTAQALEGGRGPPARGVELCECPRQYSASSCQDPSIGFFRWHDRSAVHSTIVIQMVGEARPCECSGRSTVCDVETGHCKNCSSNTGGPACDRCAEGFYGDPDGPGGCRACPCPSEQRNFATSCEVVDGAGAGADTEAVCHCREGYTGARCDRCAPGWYGPAGAGGACQPCLCDPLGSVGEHCDARGRCECLPGVSGPRCSICPLRQVLTARGTCTTCEDACTGDLLRGLEDLAFDLDVGAKRAADGILEAPWAVLDGIHGRAKQARERVRAWEALAAQAHQVLGTAVATLRKPANQAVKEAKKDEHAGAEMAVSALRLRQGAEDVSAEIERAKKQIQDTVTSLRAYAAGPAPHVSSGSALADAQYVLDTIAAGMTYLEPRATHTYNNFKRCDEIYDDLVKLLDFEDVRRVDGLRRRVLRLQEGLRDLNDTLGSSSGNASHVDHRFTNKNRRKLKELVTRVAWLSSEEASLVTMVTANADTLNAADAALSAAQANLSGVRRQQARLSDLTASLAQRVRAESRPDLAHYYVIARDRANMLRHTADTYERLFSGTKSDAQLALQASAAYRNIAEAFRDALHGALNASQAAEQAYRQAYPKHLDSLLDQSSLALQDSRRLQGSAREQARRVSRLRQHLAEHEGVVDKLRETIILAGRRNNDNQRPLQQLQQLEGQLGAERGVAQRVLDDMLDEQRAALHMRLHAGEVLANVSSALRPLLARVAGGGEGEQDGQGAGLGLSATEQQVKELRETIIRVNDTLQTVEGESAEQQREFQRWNDSVADKLQALRDKITRARHAAEGIRLSLKTSKQSGAAGCSRSYALPQAGPSTTTTITLYYAATGKARSAPIFYLPSSTTEDFIALDMVERRVRLSWDVGGGPGTVTAPLALRAPRELPPGVGQTEGRDEEVWYRVVAERTGNIGHLSVSEDARPEGAAPPKVVFNASAAGFGRLDPGSVAWVGGDGDGAGARVGLAGCVHSLELDGRPIGLWNFRTSSGSCGACKQGVSQEHDDQSYNFRGDGYTELRHTSTSPYNKYFFSVSLNFRSFDENALLFLAVADDRRSYVSLSLHQGKVRYRIGYGSPGGDGYLEITTAVKYNTGNWTRVEASRYFDRNRRLEKGLLKVDSEARNGSPATPIKADALPDMSGALYYIGGVPPGFTAVGPFDKPVSFLGCMSMIQVAQEGYNLMRGQFYGVEASCADKPLRVASFGGDGYLELPSHALRKKSAFGFAFATLQPDTMLMLSTFQRPGGATSAEVAEENTNFIELEDNNSYYSCALWNGRLEVRVDAGRGAAVLQSGGDGAATPLNDGRLHAVTVTKTGRRLELRVDDVVQSSATLPEGTAAVKAPGDVGGLFFGGVPPSLNVSDLLATTMPLIGTIKDAIFNDELLSMDHPVSFQHAAIGRLSPVGPVPDATRAVGTSPVLPASPSTSLSSTSSAPSSPFSPPLPQEPESSSGGCRRLSTYSFEQDAAKFGDRPNSHVLVTFRRRNLLQRDFLVELQFRTFYPSGMLYLVPGAGGSGVGGGKQRQYLAAYLLDGIFQVVYKGRNKLEVSLPNTYNDGNWHTVRLKKEGRILTLSVDSDSPERRKGPKKMNIGHSMYIGGLPDNNLLVPDNFVQRLQHFRGCMRGLTVNNMSQDLVGDNAMHHQVGQCYANVEHGSFFAGDAYAIYKNKFVVDDLLHVELELRTSELNGIILSISEPRGYPAMSLELNSGQVILAGDIGDRRRFEITVSFPSMWNMCDNRWHRIQTSYKNGELVLQVDDMKQSQPLADDGHYIETRTNSPVYIGGLPEGAHSETLGVKDNFKGCIRKVMIGGERRDWTIMADLHNIELGSCPLVN